MRHVIGVRFLADSSQYAQQTSRVEPGGKVYSYFHDEELKEGDIVVVRTYSMQDGPFRFAKVVSVNQNGVGATKWIICKLDLDAIAEREAKAAKEEAAKALVKNALKRRADTDMLAEAWPLMTTEEKATYIEAFGEPTIVSTAVDSDKSLTTFEIGSLNPSGERIRVVTPSYEEAARTGEDYFKVGRALLTIKQL